MTISIQYVKMPESETMSAYTISRLEKLAKKYDWIINAEVFLKVDKDPAGLSKICEIELSAPGPRIFASSKEKNFELAVKDTISDLEKQLEKRKSMFSNH